MKKVIEHYYRSIKETNVIQIEDIEIFDWQGVNDVFVESPKLKDTLYTVIIYYKNVSQVYRYDLGPNEVNKIRNYNLDLILG
jgi:hypothetical protein